MIVIIGGSGSGKSAYGEEIAVSLSGEGRKLVYLATMKIYDEEGRRKVERHRILRQGKGFLTLEVPENIGCCIQEIPQDCVVLLECMSNLAANEIFSDKALVPYMEAGEKVVKDVKCLRRRTADLIIITNNIFEDGTDYDRSTLEYMEVLGWINREICTMADEVWEVVAGIPVKMKGGGVSDE